MPLPRVDPRQLLLDHLALIDQLIYFVSRRHRLSVPDAEEFASTVRLRLIEDDFALLRRFEGRSSLRTYLLVVIERLSHDFNIARWGKWRISAGARRLGSTAVLLERVIVRDGATFDQAVAILQINYQVDATREQLRELLEALLRQRRRSLPASSFDVRTGDLDLYADLTGRPPDEGPDAARISTALSEVVGQLSAEDQRILELRFEDDLTVGEIGQLIGVPRRTLYRRVDRLIRELRLALEALGVANVDVVWLLSRSISQRRMVPKARAPTE